MVRLHRGPVILVTSRAQSVDRSVCWIVVVVAGQCNLLRLHLRVVSDHGDGLHRCLLMVLVVVVMGVMILLLVLLVLLILT